METNNVIIQSLLDSLVVITQNTYGTATRLGDNEDENRATIKTLNVLIDSVRAQTVIVQQAIDSY